MKRLAAVAIVIVAALGPPAVAEPHDESVTVSASASPSEPGVGVRGPGDLEAGLFLGGFVSNYFHQFYDPDVMPDREQLDRVSPLFGVRFAMFPTRFVGVELEGSLVMASTKDTGQGAQIYGLRGQVMLQHPGRVTPFVAAGAGLTYVSSDESVLGSDADFPIHVGAGVRIWANEALAFRVDGRFIRGPSQQEPYTLNASYGELTLGLSFNPKPAPVAVREPVDPDPDQDGVVGAADACPSEDGGGSPDGCPARDADGDGVLDPADRCVSEPETVNSYQDEDGCPDQVPDSDADGIDDLHDRCPEVMEDVDGFQDDDGCPDPDNDGDSVTDAADRCPGEPGPVENLGCPDKDGDGDGVVDRLDNCPAEAGTADHHGCKKKQLVVITKEQLKILDQVRFAASSAKLDRRSNALLDNIALVLDAHPEILKVRVEGHTDDQGPDARNLKLSQSRAGAVVAYLVKKGVAAERLEAVGHGEARPLVEGKTRKAREANRRVEFNIVTP